MDFALHFFDGDNPFAIQMAAALRKCLVFNLHRIGASALECARAITGESLWL
jgi:hypothetical protein